jgi:hypothetical protein
MLATIPELAERVEQHRKVAARLRELQTKVIDLTRGVERAKQEHEKRVEEAVLAGKAPPRAQAVAGAEKKLEGAEDELRSFENALPRSADHLLAASLRHLRRTRERIDEEDQRSRGRLDELVAAVDSELARQNSLAAERLWVDSAENGGRRIEPYRELGGDTDVQQARGRLRDVFDELRWKRARKAEEVERWRRFEEEERAERERHLPELLEQDRARRVTYEGMKLTHRGGKPIAEEFEEGEDER